jgi:hypothetical protein
MTASRGYKSWAEFFGIVGIVRGLEVTWSEVHGWHLYFYVF